MEIVEKIESVELFYLDEKQDNKIFFQTHLSKPSMNARIAYLNVSEEHTEQLAILDNKYGELSELKGATIEQLSSEQFIKFQKKKKEVLMLNDLFTIKYFQAIASRNQLTTLQQEYVFKESADSKFWLMQNIQEIEKAVIFFRTDNRL